VVTWGSVTTAVVMLVGPGWRSEPSDDVGRGVGCHDVGWVSSLVRPRWGSRAGRVLVYERVGLSLLVWPRRGSWKRTRVVRDAFGSRWPGVREFARAGVVAVFIVTIDGGCESRGVLTLCPGRARASFVLLCLPVCSCFCYPSFRFVLPLLRAVFDRGWDPYVRVGWVVRRARRVVLDG
jgi:hypothetical protein